MINPSFPPIAIPSLFLEIVIVTGGNFVFFVVRRWKFLNAMEIVREGKKIKSFEKVRYLGSEKKKKKKRKNKGRKKMDTKFLIHNEWSSIIK